ncbi:SDR family NAD(P)-dependent oxidoreductase [Colwellia sp. 12G3]|uniref:SDR family NAD(P)-dependent oxidoreductase n=1 Tax=Colwellia sp. 12G3 TaxID=2058299 RepID=UPI0012FE96E1|nr:SDR family oxidoreductase [Colwellia sp. 12G3]
MIKKKLLNEVDMGLFTGKVAIVTGAAGGIGRESAIQFAQNGAKVGLADINEAGLAETAKRIAEAGGESISIMTNVADSKACDDMVAKTVSAFGKLDIIFNNAGISGDRAVITDTSNDMWDKVIAINLTGVFNCTRSALPEMVKNGSGVIVNTASVDGLVGMGTLSPYVAAKHGVTGLTKTTALEYSRKGIRCVAICPGYIVTDMTNNALAQEEVDGFNAMIPLGRGATPAEVANFVIWLASDQASYMNGSVHQIDGGLLSGMGLIT